MPMKSMLAIFALLLVFPLTAVPREPGAPLPQIRPEKVGMSSERLEKIDALTDRYVENGNYPGIVTMVSRDGKIVHKKAHGKYGVDNDKPIEIDTLFRIYSMTKPITAVAALILYEEGKFQMTDPVTMHLPQFANQKILKDGELVAPASPMRMGQLFTHTAGLTYGTTLDNPVDELYAEAQLMDSHDLDEFVDKLANLPLRFEPGTRYHYSVASDLLGAVVERLSGQTLERFLHERIFEPLDMHDTFFSVPPEKRHRLASIQVWDYELNAAVLLPDEYRRDVFDVSFFSGGGGLVSTAADYLKFCEMVRTGGLYNGVRLLGPKTVRYMSADHLTPELRAVGRGEYPSDDFYPGQSMALGFGVITNPGITPSISSMGELSWGGAAGTQFWIDPEEGIIGIAMVQLMRSPWPLRFDMKVATYQALTELAAD